MRLLAKNLQQGLQVHPVNMLGIKRQAFCFQTLYQFGMGGTQPAYCRKQAQPAAASCDHQRGHGRGSGWRAFAFDIIDDQNAGLVGIIERRVKGRPHRCMFQMRCPCHHQC